MAAAFGTDHTVIEVDPTCARYMATVVRHFDEPFGNPTAILEYLLTREVRKSVTVALSGDGGDEIFGGYVRYAGAAAAEWYRKLPRPLLRDVIAPLASRLHDSTAGHHRARRIREFLMSAWMEPDAMYLDWVGYFSEAEKRALYTPEFAREVGGHDSGEWMRELFRRGQALEPMNRLGYVDVASFLAGNCLEYADRMAMANSLEVRCPFADQQLIEFGLGVPFRYKYARGKTKLLVREAMEGVLPASVLQKKKTGFNPPMPAWLSGELRGMVNQMLSRESVAKRGFFQPAAVERLLADHFAARRDNSLKIWALLMLELWCALYVDGGARSGSPAGDAEPEMVGV